MIRQFTSEEVCLRCRGCCRFREPESIWSPNLLAEDAKALLENKIPPFFILGNKKIRLKRSPKEESFMCSFLDPEDNKCKAYAFRPFECQLYPFLVNRSKKKLFLAVDVKCHFAKEKQKSQFFKAYVQYLTDYFNAPDFRRTLKNNPHIIQEYPGVLNLVELKI